MAPSGRKESWAQVAKVAKLIFQLESNMQVMQPRSVHVRPLFCAGSMRNCMYNNRAIGEEIERVSRRQAVGA